MGVGANVIVDGLGICVGTALRVNVKSGGKGGVYVVEMAVGVGVSVYVWVPAFARM